MKIVFALLTVWLVGSCPLAHADDWLRAFNEAFHFGHAAPHVMERALDQCERSMYQSISRNLASTLIPRLDPPRCLPIERQFIAFAVAAVYLEQYQEHPSPDALEDLRVAVNRLYYVSKDDPFLATTLLVEHEEVLDDGTIRYPVAIPSGSSWHFFMGFGDPRYAVKLDDARAEYVEQVRSRAPSPIAYVCLLSVFGCFFSLPLETRINALATLPISLWITERAGRPVDLAGLRRFVEFRREEK